MLIFSLADRILCTLYRRLIHYGERYDLYLLISLSNGYLIPSKIPTECKLIILLLAIYSKDLPMIQTSLSFYIPLPRK